MSDAARWPRASVLWQIAAGIMLLGVLLRVARWAADRSLWLDEILLARNLFERSAAGLLDKLDYGQGAPPLFLLLEKAAIGLFGHGEMALRLVPLLAGCAALPAIWAVARRLLDERCAIVAVAVLALLEPAIYYSSEVKQYSTDLLATLLILWRFLAWRQTLAHAAWTKLLAIGLLAIYLSHPAVFVLAGCAAGMALWEPRRRRGLLLMACLWAAAFLPNYLLFLRPLSGDQGLRHYWTDGFTPWSLSAGAWLAGSLLGLFSDYATMWMRWPLVGFALAAVGAARLYLAAPGCALFLIGPLLAALAAAGLHAYPFSGRLLLFLVPVAVLAMAAAFLPGRKKWSTFAQIIALGILLLPLLPRPARNLLWPPGREEIQPVLAELENRVNDGDALYIYYGAHAAWEFYGPRYHLRSPQVIPGRNRDQDVSAFETDIPRIVAHGRVWLLFSHTPTGDGPDARLMEQLPTGARRLDAIEAKGSAAYLYLFP